MKQNQILTQSKAIAVALLTAGAGLMTSCAVDGFDDETFVSSVRDTQLSSPDAGDITVTASADGKRQTISWPVVEGAGGFLVSLYDESNPDEPIVKDSLVDGSTLTVPREEDINYVFSVQTLGNAKQNNTAAESASVLTFSTFTPTYATIPDGADLNQYFEANPVPDEAMEELVNYDLVAGGNYTLSTKLDFNTHKVTLRSTSKTNHATITYTGSDACIYFAEEFHVKYLDFDGAGQQIETNGGLFAFSKEAATKKGTDIDAVKYKWSNGVIEQPVSFVNSNFKNVKGYFFWDNQQPIVALTMLVDNCVVHLAPEKSLSGGVFWTNKGGHINDFYVTNSTFYELPDCTGDIKYFYQAGMVCAEDVFVDKTTATNSVNYTNSTFYRVCWNNGQWGNYNRMGGRACSKWVMTDCIFYDCSTSGSVPRRFLHGKQGQNPVFNNNTYMKNDGTFQDIKDNGEHEYDLSGTCIEEDPQFANPATGDFHISGPTQVARKTGDPRWLP